MLTSAYDVGFYSYMIATVIPNTSESVDEVISPRFLFLSFPQLWTTYTLLT